MGEERLLRRIEDNRSSRERIALREQGYNDHKRAISEAYEVTRMDFWCEKCGKDFSTSGRKQVRFSGRWPVAWYVGICPARHVAIRYITDKDHDPYYRKSVMIQKQRVEMADAMLTPDDPRFAILYPKQYREFERMREENNGI